MGGQAQGEAHPRDVDSIQILSSMGEGFRLLTIDPPNTNVGQYFGGHAIDHIAVAGPIAATFGDATTPDVVDNESAGSDHRPVMATVTATAAIAHQ